MKKFIISGGILQIKVTKKTNFYIFLDIIFNGNRLDAKQITRDTFTNLHNWVDENYQILSY